LPQTSEPQTRVPQPQVAQTPLMHVWALVQHDEPHWEEAAQLPQWPDESQ
jgi:hypothetical protein